MRVCADWYVAGYRTPLHGPGANDPLWIIASLTGFAMGALKRRVRNPSRGVGQVGMVDLEAGVSAPSPPAPFPVEMKTPVFLPGLVLRRASAGHGSR